MSVTVGEITATLNEWYPPELAEGWDNTGLLLGSSDAHVETVLTALTLTEDVAAEACEMGADLVVSHHPILFRGAKKLTADTPEGRIVLMLAKADVAVYSPHTRFDSGVAGINRFLADRLGLKDVLPIRPGDDDASVGAGRLGLVESGMTVEEFAVRVSTVCGVSGLHVVDGGRPVTKVAVACGAASEFLEDAIALGCDAFVVGECRFHSALEARAASVSLFVPGHYGTERPAVEWLAGELGRSFPRLKCLPSAVETDPLRWILRE